MELSFNSQSAPPKMATDSISGLYMNEIGFFEN